MSDLKNELDKLKKELSKVRNESEKAALSDKIRLKEKELADSKSADMKKEVVPDKESPARIDHKKRDKDFSRGDVIITDNSANIIL